MAHDTVDSQERLSALVDGELQARELGDLLSRDDAGVAEAWNAYQVIGQALRTSGAVMRSADPVFLANLRVALAEDAPARALPQAELQWIRDGREAANASQFRWKAVAGFASVVAVAAIGWSLWSVPSGANPGSMAAVAVPANGLQTAVAESAQPVMIRDSRLDELLAAHKQSGGATALQMPSGFLRNATFETSGR
jgi:sigma-E factor negative regulatory protein RseA